MYELFEQKYKECEKSLFLVAFGYLHNTEDAKDCVQEAILSALKSFSSLKKKEFFKTWITRIVINKSKDYLKRQKYTEELTDKLNVFYNMPLDEIGMMDCVCKLNSKSSIYITLDVLELRFENDNVIIPLNLTFENPTEAPFLYIQEVAIAEFKILDSNNKEIVKSKFTASDAEKGIVINGKALVNLPINGKELELGKEYAIIIEKMYGLAKADAPLHIIGTWMNEFFR